MGSASEYCHNVKTRMVGVGLPVCEKTSRIYLLDSIPYTNVTDRQTDGRTPHDGIDHAMQSVARKKN